MINKVVVKFKDGSMLKGHTENFFPNKDSFHLQPSEGNPVEVRIDDLKAVFFVKDLVGDATHKRTYTDNVIGGGRKLQIKFRDGETIVGFSVGYSPDRKGFMLVPADAKGNNERIFVVKASTEKVEFIPS